MIQITTFEMISELDRIFKKHPAAGITASVHNVGTSNNFLKDYDSRMQMAIQIVGQICRGLVDGNRERVALDIEIDSKTAKAFARYEFKLIDNRLNVRRFNAGELVDFYQTNTWQTSHFYAAGSKAPAGTYHGANGSAILTESGTMTAVNENEI